MIKSIKLLLLLACLIALFRICPAPDISADKNTNEKPGHNDNRDKDKEKPKSDNNNPKPKPDKPKPKPDKPKPDKNNPPPPKTEEKSKLSDFSQPYKEKADKKSKSSKSETSYDDNDWDDDDDGGDFWAEFWADMFADAFNALIFGDFGYRYSSCPYNQPQQPLPGIYVSTHNDTLGDMTAFQFRTYYNTVDKNIKSYGLYSKLLLPSSWTWDMGNDHYLEKVNNNMLSMNYFTTHFNTIGLTPDTNFVTEVGLGLAFLTDVTDNLHSSGSFQIRTDYFPAEPWSIRTSASFASPSDVRTTNFDATVGWHTGALEIFGGYHSLLNNKTKNLNGPTFGLALWF